MINLPLGGLKMATEILEDLKRAIITYDKELAAESAKKRFKINQLSL